MDDRTDPTRPASGARYESDLYSWAVEQAALLRAGKIAEADALNIAEELDDVGNEQYDKLESALRVILLHLLKWDHQPERRSRSWRSALRCNAITSKVLRKNPGLKPLLDEAIAEAYDDARLEAQARPIATRRLSHALSVSWNEIMERPIDVAAEGLRLRSRPCLACWPDISPAIGFGSSEPR